MAATRTTTFGPSRAGKTELVRAVALAQCWRGCRSRARSRLFRQFGAIVGCTIVTAATFSARADEPNAAPVAADAALDSISVLAGPAFGEGGTAWRAEVSPVFGFVAPLSARVDLDLAIPIGIGYRSTSRGSTGAETLWIEAAVAAEIVYVISRPFQFYAQAGFGFAWSHVTVEQAFVGYQRDSSLAGVLRIVPGLRYALSERLQLVAAPLGIEIYFGNGSTFLLSFLFGVAWTP